MARIALPRVGGILEDRQQHIDGDLAEAKRLKETSDAAIAAYEKALADARGRAQALANETREKYAAEAETARKALDNTLNERIAEAERTIAARRTAAMANVQDIAVTTAAAIVERLIGNAPVERRRRQVRSPTHSSAEDRDDVYRRILGRRRLLHLPRHPGLFRRPQDTSSTRSTSAPPASRRSSTRRAASRKRRRRCSPNMSASRARPSARPPTSSPAPRRRPSGSPSRPRPSPRNSSPAAPSSRRPRSPRPKHRRSPTCAMPPPRPRSPPPSGSGRHRQGQGRRRSDRQGHRGSQRQAELTPLETVRDFSSIRMPVVARSRVLCCGFG